MALAESTRDEFVARGLEKLKIPNISNILTNTLYELPIDCANQMRFSLFFFFVNFVSEFFLQLFLSR